MRISFFQRLEKALRVEHFFPKVGEGPAAALFIYGPHPKHLAICACFVEFQIELSMASSANVG
jgi:hypothetical protein